MREPERCCFLRFCPSSWGRVVPNCATIRLPSRTHDARTGPFALVSGGEAEAEGIEPTRPREGPHRF